MSMVHCEEVVRLLWQFMDRELDPATMERLQEHIEGCRECGPRHDFEVRLRALIRQKCGDQPAPAPLRRRVLALIRGL